MSGPVKILYTVEAAAEGGPYHLDHSKKRANAAPPLSSGRTIERRLYRGNERAYDRPALKGPIASAPTAGWGRLTSR